MGDFSCSCKATDNSKFKFDNICAHAETNTPSPPADGSWYQMGSPPQTLTSCICDYLHICCWPAPVLLFLGHSSENPAPCSRLEGDVLTKYLNVYWRTSNSSNPCKGGHTQYGEELQVAPRSHGHDICLQMAFAGCHRHRCHCMSCTTCLMLWSQGTRLLEDADGMTRVSRVCHLLRNIITPDVYNHH